jgi:dolichol kinase
LFDLVLFFISLLYASIVLLVADLARRKFNLQSEFTRRIIHLFAGFAIWSVPYYPHPWVATFVALTFVVMLALANHERFSRFFAAMARPDDLEHGSVRGPFWYAVSITVLTAFFTFTGYQQLYFVAAAAIHVMMLGDGMSAPIGIKYGCNHKHYIFGSCRTVPGCLAVFIFGTLGSLLAFWFFGIINYSNNFVVAGELLWLPMIILALLGGFSGMLIEMVSPKGTDNITVPFLTCIILFLAAIGLNIIVL